MDIPPPEIDLVGHGLDVLKIGVEDTGAVSTSDIEDKTPILEGTIGLGLLGTEKRVEGGLARAEVEEKVVGIVIGETYGGDVGVLERGEGDHVSSSLPVKGVLLGVLVVLRDLKVLICYVRSSIHRLMW